MYDIDSKDRVTRLEGVPQSSIGAPIPPVLSDGMTTVLAYYLEDTPASWDGTWVQVVDATTDAQPVAIVRFNLCHAHYFGHPNDEAFRGHPLAKRGLTPYGAFEIQNSSWIRRLERMNSVHYAHRPEHFLTLRHLIFAFHDDTFECVCDGFDIDVMTGSIASLVPIMVARFRWSAG